MRRAKRSSPFKKRTTTRGTEVRVGEGLRSAIKKRSIIVFGRKTSVSLEDEFWNAVQEIADERGSTLSGFIESVSVGGAVGNLSSLLRIAVLAHFMERSADSTRS